MEISFIFTALRRYFWLVAIGVTLGNLLASFAAPEPILSYRSSAVLVISPPTSASSQFLQASQLDRYVSTQLSVLTSVDVATAVADRFDDGLTADAVAGIIDVEAIPESDTVRISAVADAPERAQEIAQTYAETYLELVAVDIDAEQRRNLSELDGRIGAVEAKLQVVNDALLEAVRPYLETFNDAAEAGLPTQPLPQASQVDPGAAVEQTTLVAELGQLRAQRNELEFDRERVNSAVVQQASLPVAPEPTSAGLYRTAGIVVGLLVGLIAALLAGQLSPRVLDASAVTDALQVPVVAEVERKRVLKGRPDLALKPLGSRMETIIDQICVRADGMAPVERAGLVAVGSAEPLGGATTVAVAMAARYAARGYRTVLVDLDVLHPYINASFGAWLEPDDARLAPASRSAAALRTTDVPGLRVLSTSTEQESATVRRDSLDDLLAKAAEDADVVIIDVGAAVASPFASRLASRVDAFVLCVSLRSQKTNRLLDVGNRLSEAGGRLLPVLTSPHRKAADATKASLYSEPIRSAGPQRTRQLVTHGGDRSGEFFDGRALEEADAAQGTSVSTGPADDSTKPSPKSASESDKSASENAASRPAPSDKAPSNTSSSKSGSSKSGSSGSPKNRQADRTQRADADTANDPKPSTKTPGPRKGRTPAQTPSGGSGSGKPKAPGSSS